MQNLLDEKLKQVAVIGACGKMGRGIALLLLQEMALTALKSKSSSFHLKLIDPYEEGYYDLKTYLEQQLLRFAEKNINLLRELYKNREDLVGNGEIVSAFVAESMRFVDCTSSLSEVKKCTLIFEAAFEEIPVKTAILKEIKEVGCDAWVLTNTSSIPISLLAEKSGLNGQIIGCHFYNPPPVQKLLELIPCQEGNPKLMELALELATRLKKTVVVSKDVAGFIGNGHFSREIALAGELVEELSQQYPKETALQIVNSVTHDFLLRPMGIFELLDYVGVPIAENILNIIGLKVPIIQELINAGLKGGQTLEGYSKDGIFQYHRGKMQAVYSLSKKEYVPLADLSFLGSVPMGLSWKKLQKDPHDLSLYFEQLFASQELGPKLAVRFLQRSSEIEALLVETGVASSRKDVSTVLKNGFYHLYSPDEVVK